MFTHHAENFTGIKNPQIHHHTTDILYCIHVKVWDDRQQYQELQIDFSYHKGYYIT